MGERFEMTQRGFGAFAWLWLSALVIVLDQLSKAWVLALLKPGQKLAVIPDIFYWTLAFNTGAAFSFLADSGGWQRWLFTGLALVISVVLLVWLKRTRVSDWRTAVPLALIIGGAVGNLIDRIRLGHVTDFILVYFGDWAYPAFNVADSAVVVGALLLIAFSFFGPDSRGNVR